MSARDNVIRAVVLLETINDPLSDDAQTKVVLAHASLRRALEQLAVHCVVCGDYGCEFCPAVNVLAAERN